MRNQGKLKVIFLIFTIIFTLEVAVADQILPEAKPTPDQETKIKTAQKKNIYPEKKPTLRKEKVEVTESKEIDTQTQEEVFIYPEKKPTIFQKKIDKTVVVLNQEIDQAVREYTSQIKLVQVTLEDQADQEVRAKKKIDLDIKDLGELSDRKHEKLAKRLDDLEKNFFTVESNIDAHLASIKKSIDRLISELKTVKKSINEKK